jgi:dipeptidyl aminopeptidase/acylaminoacyl peptidase
LKRVSHYGRRAFVLASAAAALSPAGYVQDARAEPAGGDLVPRRLFYDAPGYAKVTISPDGSKIAFLAPVDGVQNVWIAPLSDPQAGKPVTKIDDRDVLNQLWWPGDNEHVIFCREHAGAEDWQTHCVDIETGTVRALSPGPGVKSMVHQVSARFPGELLIAHNQRDKAYFDIYRVNAATAESTLLFRNDSFAELFTDSQFNVRFGIRYRDGGSWDVVTATGEGAGSVFRSVAIGDRYTTALVGASDDGKQLYWLDSKGRDGAAVVSQEVSGGAVRTLLENRSVDFSEPVFDPVRRTPIAAPLVYTKRRWYTLDPAAAPDLDRMQVSIDGDLGCFSLSNDRAHWIVYAEPPAKPGRYFHYLRAERKVVPLFSTRPELDKARLVRLEPVVIPTRGELRLVSYLSRGVGIEAGQPGPLIILVHDGPWTRDMPDFTSIHQWLANRGYNVLSVNFRGSTGLGKKLAEAGDGEWADKMQNDLLDAFEWATNERIAKDTSVAICGQGYGGYAALIGASVTPDRFACAIDFGGMTDLVALSEATAPALKPFLPRLKVRMGGDATTDAGAKFLASRSPLTYAPRIKCPLLIAHGANDPRVPIAQSDAFVAAMQQRKLPVTYVAYNDEGHVFRRAANRISLAAVTEAFLAQNLGGRAEPVGDAFTGSSIEFRAGRELIKGLG